MRPLPVVFCLCLCLGRPCSATVGAWVNSAQSLRPLPAFVCVVFTARFVGIVGKFRTIDAAVAILVCLSCRYWADRMGAAQLVHVTRSVVLNSNPLVRACLYELGPCYPVTLCSLAWRYRLCRIYHLCKSHNSYDARQADNFEDICMCGVRFTKFAIWLDIPSL